VNQPLVPKFLRQKGTLIDKSTGLTGRQLAQHVLNKNAVKFTGSDSTDFGTAYPFLYPFFPTPFLTLAQQEYGNPRMLGQNTFSGNAPDGLLMLAGETKDINIRMNRDMNFDLLEVRYTVRARNIPNGGDVYLGRNFRINPLRAMDNYNAWPANLPIPLYQGFKVALFVRSGVERSLYGGMGRIGRKATGEFQPEPIELSSIQGEDDGKGAVRCPYLIAKEAVVTVRITAPADGVAIDGHVAGHFFVDGCLFGYKVAV
jgi:hypothetical protein